MSWIPDRKRVAGVAIALLVPVAVFASTWVGFRRHILFTELRQLEAQQDDWLERNKRVIAGIAIFRSPGRIQELAEGELALEPLPTDALTTVEVGQQ